jgi:hypothetical protein
MSVQKIHTGGSVRKRKLKLRASASRSRAENGPLDGLDQSDASPDRRCGRVAGSADKRSETALIIAVRGSADVYTIQWAERGPGADKPALDDAKWRDRLSKLNPIMFCAIVPGETAKRSPQERGFFLPSDCRALRDLLDGYMPSPRHLHSGKF